jgi:hypothetical protein
LATTTALDQALCKVIVGLKVDHADSGVETHQIKKHDAPFLVGWAKLVVPYEV